MYVCKDQWWSQVKNSEGVKVQDFPTGRVPRHFYCIFQKQYYSNFQKWGCIYPLIPSPASATGKKQLQEITKLRWSDTYKFLYSFLTCCDPAFATVLWSCNLVFAKSNGNTQAVPTEPAMAPFSNLAAKLNRMKINLETDGILVSREQMMVKLQLRGILQY